MGYGLRDPERGCFSEIGKVVARENNGVSRKHVMPGRRGGFENISKATGIYELVSCRFCSDEH